LIADNSPSVR